jgi:hypothetical protein
MVQKEGQKAFEQVFMYYLRTDANTSCVRIDSFKFTCKFSLLCTPQFNASIILIKNCFFRIKCV